MIQYFVSGLASGSIYTLLGLGMALTFKCTSTLNFAQGELSMLMTFVCFSLMVSVGLGFPAALAITLVVAVLAGSVIYRLSIYPLRLRDVESLAFTTLALKLSATGLAALIWGPAARQFPAIFVPDRFEFLGVTMAAGHFWAIVLAVISSVGITLFLKFSEIGIAMRAASEDPEVASLLGIDLRVIGGVSWMIAMVLGTLTGVLLASATLLSPYMLGLAIIKVFAALLLGGMTSVFGVMFGGLLLGLTESFVAYLFDPLYQDSTALLLILAVLMLKPEGILGLKQATRH